MADTLRITYDGTDIDFSPQVGFTDPGALDRARHEAADGTLYLYTFHTKKRWSVPIRFMAEAKATNLNSWWENGYTVVFTPDRVGASATTHNCKIMNPTRPLASFPIGFWEDYFQGTLILQET